MGVQDWIAAYRIGTTQSRLAPSRIAALGVIAILQIVAVCVGYDEYAHAWHRHHLVPWHYVHMILLVFCLGPAVFMLLMPLLLKSISTRKVTVRNRIVTVSTKTSNTVIQWKYVYGIYKDMQHIAISSGRFDALVVPLRAFPNEQAATAFFEMALDFWHEANGTLPPPVSEAAGVWPPAPRPSDSVEPGEGR